MDGKLHEKASDHDLEQRALIRNGRGCLALQLSLPAFALHETRPGCCCPLSLSRALITSIRRRRRRKAFCGRAFRFCEICIVIREEDPSQASDLQGLVGIPCFFFLIVGWFVELAREEKNARTRDRSAPCSAKRKQNGVVLYYCRKLAAAAHDVLLHFYSSISCLPRCSIQSSCSR